MSTQTLIVEKELAHPPAKVWRALTQPALIAEWLLKNDFQPVVGHRCQFRFDPMPNWDGVIESEVLVVEPDRKLSYTWSSLGLVSVVVLTLSATPGGTLLRLEQSGFRADQQAAYQGANHGWRKFLGRLDTLLAGLTHDAKA